jgi:hypothetical protein
MALPESPLLDLLKFDEAEGTIRWKHRRMLLFDADAMGLLRRELVDALGLAAARRILTGFGDACGYRDALTSKGTAAMEASGGAVGAGSVASCPRRDRTLPNTAFQNRRSKQHLRS